MCRAHPRDKNAIRSKKSSSLINGDLVRKVVSGIFKCLFLFLSSFILSTCLFTDWSMSCICIAAEWAHCSLLLRFLHRVRQATVPFRKHSSQHSVPPSVVGRLRASSWDWDPNLSLKTALTHPDFLNMPQSEADRFRFYQQGLHLRRDERVPR